MAAATPSGVPLSASWRWYEHLVDTAKGQLTWEEKMRMLGSTATSDEFWGEVLPKWEDPTNEQGGECFARKPFPSAILNALWELVIHASFKRPLPPPPQIIVLGLVSDTFGKDSIMGARVCDKSARGRSLYRLEVWYGASAVPEEVPLL
ncbi:hypothetical protein T492DRAFT_840347 [Pavlovales sp. CCMP2436]|nr:hypothetical protein T492DRAFT_840347 [Pavlovales sp. CCMP2436]